MRALNLRVPMYESPLAPRMGEARFWMGTKIATEEKSGGIENTNPVMTPPHSRCNRKPNHRQVVVSGGVWLLCIRRVNVVRSQISEHMVNWERRELGEEVVQEETYGDGLMHAIVDPELDELERRRAEVDAV